MNRYCSLTLKYKWQGCVKTKEPICCVGCDEPCDMECESAWFFSEKEPCHHSISKIQDTNSSTSR